ncbi:pimeloyl-ACP methyl ester carboxylesterase [Kibdelosporangium banguiense]|uniref:Pimeloyl-ACP methyl ester carboxylesterase n=1 Tax=Kibdelosporangium banguiense TaxID=1365924 RepID=A0ABS4TA58_9PSEU|nr:alpha/beta hydrolase [Kibdelosporangium banguiense]MBP2321199.1 pimeloyl-ACP methyl ester carboxylesterase [Kibdelosporangium banguiense]
MATSDSLGTAKSVRLSRATIDYRERGEGPPVVFVHGLLVNADLWRNVVPAVAEAGNRCIAPDWPLGGHTTPVPGADLTPPGVADMIAEFLATLDLTEVTVVANDTGGALVQLLMTRHPDRIARVVLTPSDCFDHFFPPAFAPLPKIAKVPGSMWIMAQLMRVRALHRLPVTFGWLTKRPIPNDFVDSYLSPSRHSPAIRRDLRAFLKTVHKRYTLEAAGRLGGFGKPVLLAWAAEDKVFPIKLAHRLAALLPDASIKEIGDSLTFVPEDRPAELATLILEFGKAAS